MYELNNIYNEDSYAAIKNIPDNSIDLIIIDPPYKLQKRGTAFHKKPDYIDEIENKKLDQDFDYSIFDEVKRVMKKLNIYIFCSRDQLHKVFDKFRNENIDLLVWHKTNPIPTVNNKYLSDLEYIIFVREKGVKVYGSYATLSKLFQTIVNKRDKQLFKHQTIKPLQIIKNLIINSSQENDVIADFFIGSGTTAVAAKELKRQFIGFEIDLEYYEIAKNRINGITANGQTSIFTDFEI